MKIFPGSLFKVMLFFLGIHLAYPTYGQTHNYKRFASEYGIQVDITCLFQDSRGYLWIGTKNGGVNRFDGLHFINYSKSNGLLSNFVIAICEDKKGNVWVGTKGGLSRFGEKKFTFYTTKNGLLHNSIRSMVCGKNGNIWLSTDAGLMYYDGKKFHAFTEKNGLKHFQVEEIYADRDSNLWFSYHPDANLKIVSRYDGKNFKHYHAFGTNKHGKVNFFYQDKNGNIWLGGMTDGPGKLSFLRGNTFYPCRSLSGNFWVAGMAIDSKNNIWLSSGNGVLKADYKKVLQLENDTALPSANLFKRIDGISIEISNCVMEDDSKNLWFGTENGVVKYEGDVFLHYGKNEGVNGGVFKIFEDPKKNLWVADDGINFCVLQGDTNFKSLREVLQVKKAPNNPNGFIDGKGNIWIGSGNEGLYKFDGEKVIHFTEAEGLKKIGATLAYARPGYFDKQGRVWCGTNAPGYIAFSVDERLPEEKQIQYLAYPANTDSAYLKDKAYALFLDSQGRIFLTFGEQGLAMIENGKFKSLKKTQGLPIHFSRHFFEDSKGRVWIPMPMGFGISRFENGKFTNYNISSGFTDVDTWKMIEDKNGNVWIATDGDGIFIFHHKTFTRISKSEGLNDNTVWNLLEDKNGFIWAGTNNGINKISVDKNLKIKNIKSYSANEGFIGVECNHDAVYEDSRGNIWFGTPIGATRYAPGEDNAEQHPPKLNLLGIKLFFNETDWTPYGENVNEWTGLPTSLTLPYDKNHLTFSFIGISMRSSEKIKYKFMLEGEESKWSPETDKNEITYSNLNPGTYTFKVMSCNADGIWNKKPLEFSFTILPPWWQTWWFRTLAFLVLVMLLYSLYRWRMSALLKRQALLEKTVTERTEEVVHQKEIIQEKNKEIIDSINYAKRIQDAILPSPKMVKEHLPESFILYMPKDIVAGDFYFVEPLKDKIIFAAADCTGHGVPGAMVSVVCSNALKRTVKEFMIDDPGRLLDKTTEIVLETFEKSETDVKDGMDISLCALNYKTKTLQWSGANNPLWIIRDGKCIEFSPDKQPIGKFDYRKPFTTHEFSLEKGDQIFIFTDGYADQFGGEKNKKFKLANMKSMFMEIHSWSCDEQMKEIKLRFEKWRAGFEQVDDVCIIGLKIE